MFKKKDEEKKVEDEAPREDHAYEDSWYRSLKALREQEQEGHVAANAGSPTGDESEEPSVIAFDTLEDALGSTDGGEDASIEAAGRNGEVSFGAAGGDEDRAPEPSENGEAPSFDPPDVEARAGQLLERLRAIQRRGDE